ncbi:GNAT family N-acetyltransferase [Clostridium pasteurianum]|uniref:GNAT family N-acetyltransferase n=1 Tax=Clostridium pasteurianum TaxID=1501 RepID=UPI0022609A61|nr:GNAT family N-acetyltransferase [Clostridium pasteurianum]UZW12699.1 GNAT family N-acetyltransferase [Clostridium pasteurianum]
MFDVNIKYGDVSISSIEKEDVKHIRMWYNSQKSFLYNSNDYLETNEFYERFIEYYMSECEIFLKIKKMNNIIGIFKGRIEFKNKNMVWVSCFAMETVFLDNNEGNIVLDNILKFFLHNFGIEDFLIGVSVRDKKILNVLKNSGFQMVRISNDFFMNESNSGNAVILKKKIYG